MELLPYLRRRRRYTNAVLCAFVLAWLQMAVVPCLMAADLAESQLAAGAPATHGAHDGGVAPGTVADGSAHEHCDYCPAGETGSTCVEASGDCTYVHDPGVDTRDVLQSQVERLATHAALIDSSAFGLLRVLREPAARAAIPTAPRPPHRPVILENCVQRR